MGLAKANLEGERQGVAAYAGEFDLGRLAEACANHYRQQARARGVDFSLILSADIEGRVSGDAAGVSQILDSLVSNAVKFTAAGRIRVMVGRDRAGQCLIEVCDTGPGFDEQDAERLFAGSGLSRCRQLAEHAGGTVTAWGRRGRGAAFTATLPLPPAEAAMTGAA